jgi:hypothetical protein
MLNCGGMASRTVDAYWFRDSCGCAVTRAKREPHSRAAVKRGPVPRPAPALFPRCREAGPVPRQRYSSLCEAARFCVKTALRSVVKTVLRSSSRRDGVIIAQDFSPGTASGLNLVPEARLSPCSTGFHTVL